jgi:hypothetical protein
MLDESEDLCQAANDCPAPHVAPNANRTIAYIVGGMISLVFAGLLLYALTHAIGVIGALVLVTAPVWGYGLYRGVRFVVSAHGDRKRRDEIQADEERRKRDVMVQRSMQDQRNRLIRELKSLAEPELMITLAPADFERYVLQYFSLTGFQTEETATVADGGIDGVLRQGSETSFIHCKRYLQAVGEPEIRDFLGAVTKHGASRGYFVTTSSFNQNARTFAGGTNITLIDGESLATMVKRLQCVDPKTGQPVELPAFNSDHWHELSFVRREARVPSRG